MLGAFYFACFSIAESAAASCSSASCPRATVFTAIVMLKLKVMNTRKPITNFRKEPMGFGRMI